MRKQTKLVAVLSAAALLALGASMTSFAAGWEKDEAGVWHFYDEDDELVTGEWKKDGGKWFYLDDDGDMLTRISKIRKMMESIGITSTAKVKKYIPK